MPRPPVFSFLRSAGRRTRGNLATLAGLIGLLVAIVLLYTFLFHAIMRHEGRTYSWLTGVYWTLQTMSTLGYGDVVFEGDLGHVFAMLVLGTGVMVLFIFLPFTLIQFFYAPWLEARAASRAPRELPAGMSGHVLLTAHGPIESALIERLEQFNLPYAVIVSEVPQALALYDRGVQVMVGQLDDAATYRQARVDRASLVATTLTDATNANVALTVRSVSTSVPIVATAAWESSMALLTRAGCTKVVQLGELLGRALALRIAGQDGQAHVVGELEDLVTAEAAAANTPMVGRTLRELALGERLNLIVAGVWERGRYIVGEPDVEIKDDSVLLLSGTREALDAYNREVRVNRQAAIYALIIGAGSVGRATSQRLAELGIDHRIIEQSHDRARDWSHLVIGDATDPNVLMQAGLDRAVSVAITTRDDDVNTYVTLQCRDIRPDVQILSRVTHERNMETLYLAGADVVLSYFPVEANAIFGVLQPGHLTILAEGLDLFVVPVPRTLVGKSLASARLRQTTGCNVVAVRAPGEPARTPDPQAPLAGGTQLMIVGDRQAARRLSAVLGKP